MIPQRTKTDVESSLNHQCKSTVCIQAGYQWLPVSSGFDTPSLHADLKGIPPADRTGRPHGHRDPKPRDLFSFVRSVRDDRSTQTNKLLIADQIVCSHLDTPPLRQTAIVETCSKGRVRYSVKMKREPDEGGAIPTGGLKPTSLPFLI